MAMARSDGAPMVILMLMPLRAALPARAAMGPKVFKSWV